VLRSEEQLPRLSVKPLRQGRRHLAPADGVDVSVLGEVSSGSWASLYNREPHRQWERKWLSL
jgi:hypothetical protein